MKTKIKLPISIPAKLLVEVGDKVNTEGVVAEVGGSDEEKIIHVARLLHVKEDRVASYLTRRVGEEVSESDVLAEKKNWISRNVVKSPVRGLIREVDLKRGTLVLVDARQGGKRKVTSPVAGRVTHIDKSYIELEFEGYIFKGQKGGGGEAIGSLKYIAGEKIGIFDVNVEVEEAIVLAKSLTDEVVVKLDVLGAKGAIVVKILNEIPLPWIQVEEDVFGKIASLLGKKAILRPAEKEIYVS